MTRQEFEALCMKCVEIVRQRCPRDTGNLQTHGVKFIWEGDNFIIYVDESEAPYMPYTNEPWISDYWNRTDKNGNVYKLKNPNEAWWKDATRLVKEFISKELNGEKENDST